MKDCSQFLTFLVISQTFLIAFGPGLMALHVRPKISQQNAQSAHSISSQTGNNEPIYLESMEDLEHVAYLSLRNFNLTDENLLQSSLTYMQRQRNQDQVENSYNQVEDTIEYRLALMLESFIYHLRKDHLKRIELEELKLLVKSMNMSIDDPEISSERDTNFSMFRSVINMNPPRDRCHYLVHLYRLELENRERSQQQQQQQQVNGQSEVAIMNGTSTHQQSFGFLSHIPNVNRLLSLCRLVVDCQSADNFLKLITGPWRSDVTGAHMMQPLVRNPESNTDEREVEGLDIDTTGGFKTEESRPKITSDFKREPDNLRDSLSMSLAKLCPLILFQLHDSEESCIPHRDDRPPLIAVWAFATLFITIVSFCSLIGLIITPFLGPSATTADSSLSDFTDSSSTSTESSFQPKVVISANQVEVRPSRACITLFEGLAVGSLVGSGLFSLIPQAFELQERESNQGFLVKALIIFFGIYLFFCSERIMRIILDARQKRKRIKRLTRLGSTSIPLHPSTTMDGYEAHQGNISQIQFGPIPNNPNSLARDRLNWRSAKLISNSNQRKSKNINGSKRRLKVTIGVRNIDPNLEQIKGDWDRKKSVGDMSRNTRRNVVNFPHEGSSHTMDRHELQVLMRSNSRGFKRNKRYFQETMKGSMHDTKVRLNNSGMRQARFKKAEEDCNSSRSFDSTSSRSWLTDESKERSASDRDHRVSSISSRDTNSDTEWVTESPRNKKRAKQFGIPASSLPVTTFSRYQNTDQNEAQTIGVKQDISTVAWMIVLGDGLHNFIDGISIGAAFSESILSGVSMSVAVICEEFPHELGDFAVLISSGMTVRQALGYNFLSACTCYLGMAFGIILGDVDEGASYLSALAAGVFLYIALVDMMGELSATLEESSRESIAKTLNLLFLQNVGIFVGISIIFVLSFIDF